MSGIGGVKEMLARQASEQAETVTRLTESELQKRRSAFEQLLSAAHVTTEKILEADREARNADRLAADESIARQIACLEKRLKLDQAKMRRELRKDTFRPILIGALTSALTMTALLLALLATLKIL